MMRSGLDEKSTVNVAVFTLAIAIASAPLRPKIRALTRLFLRSLLPTNLTLFSCLLQLPIALSTDLLSESKYASVFCEGLSWCEQKSRNSVPRFTSLVLRILHAVKIVVSITDVRFPAYANRQTLGTSRCAALETRLLLRLICVRQDCS